MTDDYNYIPPLASALAVAYLKLATGSLGLTLPEACNWELATDFTWSLQLGACDCFSHVPKFDFLPPSLYN